MELGRSKLQTQAKRLLIMTSMMNSNDNKDFEELLEKNSTL